MALPVTAGIGGCAYGIPEVDPVDIPRLEQALAANAEDTEVQVQLGMAYFEDQQYERALELLQGAVDAGQETGPGMLYLGMTHEEFEDWTAAEAAYSRFLEVGRSEELKNVVRDRLQLIGQNVLRQQARQALANEESIGEPTPRSIAVMPFAYFSENEDLMPLIYALSDMMTTDFAVSNALTVLERANIQTLLDEIGLAEDGYADPATGARAGRLLQAEHVVQGVLTPLGSENLQITTEVLNVPNQSTVGSPEAEDALQNLFEMEKQLVITTIRDVLGIQLTPAEEQGILDNRAANVLAFLSYGRGLRERDQGNYAEAAAQFQQAQQADPGFQPAAQATQQTQAMESASQTSTNDMADAAATTGETTTGTGPISPPSSQVVTGSASGPSNSATQTANNASDAVDPSPTNNVLPTSSTDDSNNTSQRSDPVEEATNTDAVTQATAVIRILVTRPGGEDR